MRRNPGRGLLGAILLFTGAFFMLRDSGLLKGEAFLIFLGLGFVLGYLISGRRVGLLISGVIMIAVGSFAYLQQAHFWRANAGGGWFFILLGLAFAAVFVIDSPGRQDPTVWPLYPAAALCVFGFLVLSVDTLPGFFLRWGRDIWPALMMGIGLLILLSPRRRL